MKKSLLIFLLCSLMIKCSSQNNKVEYNLSEKTKAYLIKVIDSMYEVDQGVRLAHYRLDSLYGLREMFFINNKKIKQEVLGSKFESYNKSVDSIWGVMKKNDVTNTEKLIDLVNKYGFPSNERLGVHKAKAYMIFVHSPSSYFNKIRELINVELAEGRITEYKKDYIFWHLNGRNGMPPKVSKDGRTTFK